MLADVPPRVEIEGAAHLLDQRVQLRVGQPAPVLRSLRVEGLAPGVGWVRSGRRSAPAEEEEALAALQLVKRLGERAEFEIECQPRRLLQLVAQERAHAGEEALQQVGGHERRLADHLRAAGRRDQLPRLGQIILAHCAVARERRQAVVAQRPALQIPGQRPGGTPAPTVEPVD